MAAAISFLQAPSDGANATSYTFSSQSLGSAAADRRIIVAVHARKLGTSTTVGVTVGGVTATNVVTQWGGVSNDNVSALFIAEVPTGTTGDVVVTFGAGVLRCGVGMWRATGVDTAAFDTASTNVGGGGSPSTSIDVQAGGFAVGALTFTTSGGSTSWSGLTEDYDSDIGAEAAQQSGSHDEFASAQTGLTVQASTTGGATPFCLVVASWSETTAGTQNLTGTLFQSAPTFNTGTVSTSYDLTGSLFQNTPTFPQGTVGGTVTLNGTLFQNAPSFQTGTVDATYDLTASLFQNTPSFPQGAVTVGTVTLTGSLFQNTPTFPQGTISETGSTFWTRDPVGFTKVGPSDTPPW